jgi:indolepyruvate ferredoxin oxidoreductase beta subunit
MVLLGAAIHALGIDHDKMLDGVRRVFARKGEAVVNTNIAAVEIGYKNAKL